MKAKTPDQISANQESRAALIIEKRRKVAMFLVYRGLCPHPIPDGRHIVRLAWSREHNCPGIAEQRRIGRIAHESGMAFAVRQGLANDNAPGAWCHGGHYDAAVAWQRDRVFRDTMEHCYGREITEAEHRGENQHQPHQALAESDRLSAPWGVERSEAWEAALCFSR